jgi:hypothetical protein
MPSSSETAAKRCSVPSHERACSLALTQWRQLFVLVEGLRVDRLARAGQQHRSDREQSAGTICQPHGALNLSAEGPTGQPPSGHPTARVLQHSINDSLIIDSILSLTFSFIPFDLTAGEFAPSIRISLESAGRPRKIA